MGKQKRAPIKLVGETKKRQPLNLIELDSNVKKKESTQPISDQSSVYTPSGTLSDSPSVAQPETSEFISWDGRIISQEPQKTEVLQDSGEKDNVEIPASKFANAPLNIKEEEFKDVKVGFDNLKAIPKDADIWGWMPSDFKQKTGVSKVELNNETEPQKNYSDVLIAAKKDDIKKAQEWKDSELKISETSDVYEGLQDTFSQAQGVSSTIPSDTISSEEANKKASEYYGEPITVQNPDGTVNHENIDAVNKKADRDIGLYNANLNDKAVYEAQKDIYGETYSETWQDLKSGTKNLAVPVFLTLAEAVSSPETADRAWEAWGMDKRKDQYKSLLMREVKEENWNKGVSELIAEGEFEDARKVLAMQLTQQVPQIAAMVLAPEIGGVNLGMVGMGISSGTSKWGDLRSRPDLTTTEKVGISTLMGIAEFATEQVFKGDINAVKGIGSVDGSFIKAFFKGAKEEVIEEEIVALTEFFTNVYTGDKTNPYEFADAAILAGIMGGGMTSSAQLASKGASATGSVNTQQARQSLSQEYSSLNKEISSNNSLSPNEKIVLRERLNNVIKESEELIKEDVDFYNKFDKKDVDRVVKLNQEIKKLESIEQSSESPVVKQSIQKEISNLQQEKSKIEESYAEKEQATEQPRPEATEVLEGEKPSDRVEEAGKEPVLDEGRTIEVKSRDGEGIIGVIELKEHKGSEYKEVNFKNEKGEDVAYIRFTQDGKVIDPEHIQVQDNFKGKGFGNAIYDSIESGGYKIKISETLLDEGLNFRVRRILRKAGYSKEEIDRMSVNKREMLAFDNFDSDARLEKIKPKKQQPSETTEKKESGATQPQEKPQSVKTAPVEEIKKSEPSKEKVKEKQRRIQNAAINEVVSMSSKEDAKQQISEHLKSLTKQGVISNSKAKSLSNAAAKVNPESQASIDTFKNYATNVFEHAEYADNVKQAERKVSKSKKNLNKTGKLGVDETGIIAKSLKVDPKSLNNEEIKEYNKYLDKTSARGKSVDVADIVVSANEIVKKYEDRVDKEVKNQTAKNEKEVDEVEAEELTNVVLEQKKNTEITGKDEVDENNYNFIESLTKDELNELKPAEKKSLAVEIKNFQDGNTTKGFYEIKRKVESKRKSDAVKELVDDGKFRTLLRDKLMNPLLNLFDKAKGNRELIFRYIKNNPLSDIDRAVKRVDQAIHNTVIEPLAIAQTKHRAFVERVEESMIDYIKMPSNPLKRKKWVDSQIKMMMIALHLENKTNPDSPETNPVEEYVKETIDFSETPRATKVDKDHADDVKRVFDKYKKNGKFDFEKAQNELTRNEKLFMGMASVGLRDAGNMEAHNAARRGDVFRKREDYVPILAKYNQDLDLNEVKEMSQQFFKPSTESGRTTARTKGAKPIKFIYQEAVFDAVKGASLDYHYGEPLSTTSNALNNLMKDKSLNETQKAFTGALQDAIVNITEGIFLDNMFKGKGFIDKSKRVLMKRGYQLALAGTGRAVDEFVSNSAHAMIYRPKDFAQGMKIMTETLKGNELKGGNFRNLLSAVGSTQLSRMFSKDATGKMMEGGWIESLGKTYYGRAVDKVADALISTPDKVVSRTLWAGTFYNQFKTQTGKDVDVERIIKDVEYRNKHKDEIREAKRQADTAVIESVASTNPWEGVIESRVRPDDGIIKQFDKYMTRFARFEFASLMKGIESAVGKGRLSRKEGAALAVATVTRMGIYSAILGGLGGLLPYAMYSLFGGDDNEEFDKQIEESFDLTSEKGQDNWTRSFLGSALTLLLMRRLGNIQKTVVSYGVEEINKNYLDFLRGEDKYNPYEHSLVFSSFSPQAQTEDYKGKRPAQYITPFLGAYGNFGKTLDRGILLADRAANNKTEESRKRAMGEVYSRIIPELIMETIGMPFAKDIRKAILLEIYESYKNSSSKKSRGSRKVMTRGN